MNLPSQVENHCQNWLKRSNDLNWIQFDLSTVPDEWLKIVHQSNGQQKVMRWSNHLHTSWSVACLCYCRYWNIQLRYYLHSVSSDNLLLWSTAMTLTISVMMLVKHTLPQSHCMKWISTNEKIISHIIFKSFKMFKIQKLTTDFSRSDSNSAKHFVFCKLPNLQIFCKTEL